MDPKYREQTGGYIKDVFTNLPPNAFTLVDFDKVRCRNKFENDIKNIAIDNLYHALSSIGFVPKGSHLELDKFTIFAYKDCDGERGIFLTTKEPNRQVRVGMPDALLEGKVYYVGITCNNDEDWEFRLSMGNGILEEKISYDEYITNEEILAINNIAFYFKCFEREGDVMFPREEL